LVESLSVGLLDPIELYDKGRTMKSAICIGCGALLLILSGCSQGLGEQIRERDFRAVKAQKVQRASPSPIADIHDMNGWTSDLDGAIAFARENGQNTAIFFYTGMDERVELGQRAMKAADRSIGRYEAQRAAVDLSRTPGAGASYGIAKGRPAVVVVGPNGAVVSSTAL
jgi:hypothetical protein